jgi:hypothetical protein
MDKVTGETNEGPIKGNKYRIECQYQAGPFETKSEVVEFEL